MERGTEAVKKTKNEALKFTEIQEKKGYKT